MQCGALTNAGTPCRAIRQIVETPEGPRCLAHDPARRAQLIAQSKLGAQRSAAVRGGTEAVGDYDRVPFCPPAQLATAADCLLASAWTHEALRQGVLAPRVAKEMATAVRNILESLKQGSLAQRLADAEALITRLLAQTQSKQER